MLRACCFPLHSCPTHSPFLLFPSLKLGQLGAGGGRRGDPYGSHTQPAITCLVSLCSEHGSCSQHLAEGARLCPGRGAVAHGVQDPPKTCVHLSPCQAGGCGQPQPAYYCSIQLNIDGSVWRSAQASQQTPEKTKIHLALTMSSLTDIFFPDPLLGRGGGGAEALWRG